MDFFSVIVEMIDLRSFSNMWYWIALAVLWSSASHRVLGVPFDMVGRAQKHGGERATDLKDAVRAQVNRMLHVFEVSGIFVVALVFFLLTLLALLGFVYAIEFAQSVFLMAFPMSLVGLVNLRAAYGVRMAAPETEALCRTIIKARFQVQLIGIVSIFVTALWGMYQNISIGALG